MIVFVRQSPTPTRTCINEIRCEIRCSIDSMRTFECFDEFNLVCFISGLFLNVYFKEEHEFPINKKSRNMKVKLQVYIYIYIYIEII